PRPLTISKTTTPVNLNPRPRPPQNTTPDRAFTPAFRLPNRPRLPPRTIDPAMIDIASLFIIRYPDPRLRRRAQPIAEINDEVRAVAQRMVELMHEARGVGL